MSSASWQPRIVALVCRWCTYAGADMAGTARRSYPATVRLLKVPCTGRMNPLFVLEAFEQGADGVLVSGCHPGDCHYVHGNMAARRRFTVWRELLSFVGIDPDRLHFSWISAAEGLKFASVIAEVTEKVRAAGPLGQAAAGASPAFALPARPEPPRALASPEEQQAITAHLRGLARRLLEEKTVDSVVGHAQGCLPGQSVPVFASTPAECDLLEWSDRARTNLSVYTAGPTRRAGTMAVVTRACDARSLVVLLGEGQVRREDLVLVGVRCTGVASGDGQLASKCYGCDGQVPATCDFTVDASGVQAGAVRSSAGASTAPDPRAAELAALDALPPQARWTFWQDQFARCLRCYACRAACPQCSCGTCITEKTRPQWIPVGIGPAGNTAWNVVRAAHLAGRCGECDECARVCPSHIRLDLLNHKLADVVERSFGARAGLDVQAAPPLATFRPDDPGEFFL